MKLKTYEKLLFIIKNIRYVEYTVLFLNSEIIKRRRSKSKQEERITYEQFEEDCMVSAKETAKTVSYTLGMSK